MLVPARSIPLELCSLGFCLCNWERGGNEPLEQVGRGLGRGKEPRQNFLLDLQRPCFTCRLPKVS